MHIERVRPAHELAASSTFSQSHQPRCMAYQTHKYSQVKHTQLQNPLSTSPLSFAQQIVCPNYTLFRNPVRRYLEELPFHESHWLAPKSETPRKRESIFVLYTTTLPKKNPKSSLHLKHSLRAVRRASFAIAVFPDSRQGRSGRIFLATPFQGVRWLTLAVALATGLVRRLEDLGCVKSLEEGER